MPTSRKRKAPSAAKKARRMARIAAKGVRRRLATQVHALKPPKQGTSSLPTWTPPLRSIAQMINTMADALGVPEDNMNQVTEQVGATSEAEYEAAKQQFEQIPVAPIDDGQVPLWQRVKGLFGKETLH